MNAYELANLAEVSSPDSTESPGAKWLVSIQTAATDHVSNITTDPDDDEELSDACHELADSLVPIYTHERWTVFVDLAAYNEDTDDYGQSDTMTDAAGVALYIIARRLLEQLLVNDDAE